MSPQPAQTTDLLLDAAEQLFARRGYAAVSVREIVEAADVNIAAVNYHFGSKARLYQATVQRVMQRKEAQDTWSILDQPVTDAAHAAELLRAFIAAMLSHILHDDQSAQACRLIMWEMAEPTEAFDFVVRDYIRPHEALMMRIVQTLRPDVEGFDAALLTHAILGQLFHYAMLRPLIERLTIGPLDDNAKIRAIADHITAFSLRGLGVTNAARESNSDTSNSNEHARNTRSCLIEPQTDIEKAPSVNGS